MSYASKQGLDKVILAVRVEREELEKVKKYASDTGTTVSQLVRDLLKHLLFEAEKHAKAEKNKVEQL